MCIIGIIYLDELVWNNFIMQRGFTLAEVLITLSIIGIVASFTIPVLINDYQKTQYVTGFKKAYTEFNQALKQMASDNGCVDDLKCTGLFDWGQWDTGTDALGDELVKYFKIAKNCRRVAGQGCFPAQIVVNYDGSLSNGYADIADDSIATYKFMTVDGMSFGIRNSVTNCQYEGGGASSYMNQRCGYIIVDVNGLKGPNYIGRDIFGFYITNGKGALLYPYGGIYTGNAWWSSNNQCTDSDKYGYACAGRVMEEGWKMDY